MPNIRGTTSKPRARAAAPHASGDAKAASRAKAPPATGDDARTESARDRSESAQAKSAGKAATPPPAAKRAKIAPKPKWVSTLSSPEPAEKPRRSSGRSTTGALDQGVNASPSKLAKAADEPSSTRRTADARTKEAEAAKPAADKTQPASAARKASPPSTAAKLAAKAARPEAPAAPPAAGIAAKPAPAVAPPPPPPPASKVGEPAPAIAEAPVTGPGLAGARSVRRTSAPAESQARRTLFGSGGRRRLRLRHPLSAPRRRGACEQHRRRDRARQARRSPPTCGRARPAKSRRRSPMKSAKWSGSFGHVAEYYMSEPQRALEAQTALTTQFIDLVGRDAAALPGRSGHAGRRARPFGQAVLGRGMARQSVLRFSSNRPMC